MITIYATKICPWCVHVEKYLTMKGVEFVKEYVDDDADKRTELYEKTGMMSVPVTTDGSTYVVGWDAHKLAKLVS